MQYSFDDQYNIVTAKCNASQNLLIQNFSAIDYFQFTFTELELHNCWKLINQFTDDTANCYIPQSTNRARLENLVWRKWTKVKYNLKETDPQFVNWHKDSDITWLYGPLVQSTFDQPQNYTYSSSAPSKTSSSPVISVPSLKNSLEDSRRSESFSSLSTTSTLDVGSYDNTYDNCCTSHRGHADGDDADDDDDDKTVIFSDDEGDYTYGKSLNPKPILKQRTSNGPLDFQRSFNQQCSISEKGLNKSVSFADMVQIRQFY